MVARDARRYTLAGDEASETVFHIIGESRFALFAVALNTAGTVGDGYLCARLLRLPSTTLIETIRTGACSMYRPQVDPPAG